MLKDELLQIRSTGLINETILIQKQIIADAAAYIEMTDTINLG